MLLLLSRNPNWYVPKLRRKNCFWIQWTCSQVFNEHFYFLQKNMHVLTSFKLNDFAGKSAVQFHMCHLCTWSVRSELPIFLEYSCITKAGTTWLFHIAWAKTQQKKNLLKIQGKFPRSSWTLGYLVEFSNPLKSLILSAQSVRILRTNLNLSTKGHFPPFISVNLLKRYNSICTFCRGLWKDLLAAWWKPAVGHQNNILSKASTVTKLGRHWPSLHQTGCSKE